MRVLLAWIGNTDLRAIDGKEVLDGPIARAVAEREFEAIYLLSNFAKDRTKAYVKWLQSRTNGTILSGVN